jgi:hypothetical protein
MNCGAPVMTPWNFTIGSPITIPLGDMLSSRMGELDDVDARQAPAVGCGHGLELGLGLGKSYIQAALAQARAFHEVLQRQGGLADAGRAVDEKELPGGQPPRKG